MKKVQRKKQEIRKEEERIKQELMAEGEVREQAHSLLDEHRDEDLLFEDA